MIRWDIEDDGIVADINGSAIQTVCVQDALLSEKSTKTIDASKANLYLAGNTHTFCHNRSPLYRIVIYLLQVVGKVKIVIDSFPLFRLNRFTMANTVLFVALKRKSKR
jgi:hypothetical protein